MSVRISQRLVDRARAGDGQAFGELLGRFFEERSYAELAVRLGRTEGALRVLHTRALRRLRDMLDALDEELETCDRTQP